MRVTAHATRSGRWWAVTVREVDGAFTQSRRLDQVPQMVQDAVALLTGEESSSIVVDVVATTALDDDLRQVAALRRSAEVASHAASARTRELVANLTSDGYTVRDVAFLLGISPQRVSQLSSGTATRTPA